MAKRPAPAGVGIPVEGERPASQRKTPSTARSVLAQPMKIAIPRAPSPPLRVTSAVRRNRSAFSPSRPRAARHAWAR